jgi:hypothetical protein
MSYLEQKSNFNIDSAQELIDKTYYAPSIHCSYYGSFQFMKFSLKNYRNLTYDFIELECKNYARGTHGYVLDNIKQDLRKKLLNTKDYTEVKRKIDELKAFRISSDYFNTQILLDQADKSLSYSKDIIQIIKQNLK